MSRLIGETFKGEDYTPENSSRKGCVIGVIGGVVVFGAVVSGLFMYGDREAAKKLAEQQQRYPLPGASQPSTSTPESTLPETVTPSTSATTAPITPTRIPFSPAPQATAKPNTPTRSTPSASRTASPSRPATIKTSQSSSSAPKPCRVAPVSPGVAAVTNACGGDMLGYSANSAPFPLTPGTQVEFVCQDRDGNRIKAIVSNDYFYMSPASLGNPC